MVSAAIWAATCGGRPSSSDGCNWRSSQTRALMPCRVSPWAGWPQLRRLTKGEVGPARTGAARTVRLRTRDRVLMGFQRRIGPSGTQDNAPICRVPGVNSLQGAGTSQLGGNTLKTRQNFQACHVMQTMLLVAELFIAAA